MNDTNWIRREMKIFRMSYYMKEFLSIIKIEKEMCHIFRKWKTPNELVTDKLIMSLDGLNSSNPPRQIDNPKI